MNPPVPLQAALQRPSACLTTRYGSSPTPGWADPPPTVVVVTVIDVYADIVCPFAHAGLRTVVRRRKQLGRDMVLRVRAWPLELVNGTPLDPAVTWEHAGDLRTQVAPDLFRHLDVDRFPSSTLDALAVANRPIGRTSGSVSG